MTLEETKLRTIDELKSEVEKAKAVEKVKKELYTQAKASWMSLY